MRYQLQGFTIKGLILDDVLKEVRLQVDILVGIEGADPRFQTNNSNVDFIVKGFVSYEELSAKIKESSVAWVTENYPNT